MVYVVLGTTVLKGQVRCIQTLTAQVEAPSLETSKFSLYFSCSCIPQPRSQGFSLFVTGKAGKGPGTGRSHDFQHPDIVGVNKL